VLLTYLLTLMSSLMTTDGPVLAGCDYRFR